METWWLALNDQQQDVQLQWSHCDLSVSLARIDESWLRHQLEQTARSYPGLDGQGQGAFLIGRLSYSLARVMAAGHLNLGRIPAWQAEQLQAAVIWPKTQLLACGGYWLKADDVETLTAMIEALLSPMIEQVCRLTGLGKGAQWRLIADSFAISWLIAGREVNQEQSASGYILDWLRRAPRPFKNKRVQFFELAGAKQSYRKRSGCCRYFTAEKGRYCSTCCHLSMEETQNRIQLSLAS